jgi:hypothetical protein
MQGGEQIEEQVQFLQLFWLQSSMSIMSDKQRELLPINRRQKPIEQFSSSADWTIQVEKPDQFRDANCFLNCRVFDSFRDTRECIK